MKENNSEESSGETTVKSKKKKSEKEVISDEMLLNRQINYTIIRNLWLVVKGEVASNDESRNLYHYLNMSKTRYDRICGGCNAVVPKVLLEKVNRDMQIDEAVFTGKERLSLKMASENNLTTLDEELERYAANKIVLRKAREENNRAEKKGKIKNQNVGKDIAGDVRGVHQELKDYLKTYVVNKNAIESFNDLNMRKLAYFIKHTNLYSNKPNEYIGNLISSMKKLTFEELDEIKSESLGAYYKELKEQSSKVNLILAYRKAKKIKK